MSLPRFLLIALLFFIAGPLLADPPAPPPPEVVNITLQPAKLPRPSLKYRLYPEALELRPGNAATLYNKAILMMPPDKESKDLLFQSHEWTQVPLDKFPREEAKKLLARYANTISQVELAVLREECDWGLPIRESENPFMILLPEIQEMRSVSRLFLTRARLEIAEKKFDKALATLRTTIVLARHTSQAPTLINALVGMAVLGMVDKVLEELISQPDAPSIYWAVTTLPNPMFDMNKAMELDTNAIYLLHPELYAARGKKLSDNEWKVLHEKVQTKMARMGSDLQGLSSGPQPFDVAAQTIRGLQSLATAKPRLAEYGYKPEEIDAMPIDKLALLHDMMVYEDYRDDIFKWYSISYHQIGNRMDGFEKRLKDGPTTIVVISPQLILPAVKSIRSALVRTERRLATLRILDALRLHAYENGGKLPEKLSDVTIVPLPDNPATGKQFEYSLTDGIATLKESEPQPVQFRIAPAGK